MHEKPNVTPKIARVWRGRTTRQRADEYEKYNYEAGIKPLLLKALAVQTFREAAAALSHAGALRVTSVS